MTCSIGDRPMREEGFCVECDGRHGYTIVRNYFDKPGRGRVISSGLNLRQAQAHCHNPETSSSTCTLAAGRARTRKLGEWFDSYTDKR